MTLAFLMAHGLQILNAIGLIVGGCATLAHIFDPAAKNNFFDSIETAITQVSSLFGRTPKQ